MTTPDNLIERAMSEAAAIAGVPASAFFRDLYNADDWAFTIQCHAIVEGVVLDLLTGSFGDERLRPVFERLGFGDTRSGKLAFAAARDLLSKEELAFARALSQLRNRLVHNFREHVSFSLARHLRSLDTAERERLFTTVALPFHESNIGYFRSEFENDPKAIFILGLLRFLQCAVRQRGEAPLEASDRWKSDG